MRTPHDYPDYGWDESYRRGQITKEQLEYFKSRWPDESLPPLPSDLQYNWGDNPLGTKFRVYPETEKPENYAQGGPVMPGLGFRPLGYASGAGPRGVTAPLSGSGSGKRLAGELTAVFDALYSQQDWDQLSEFVRTNEDIFFTRGAPSSFLGSRIAQMLQNLVDQNIVSLPPTAEEISIGTATGLGHTGAITGGDLGDITTSDMIQLPLGGHELTGPTDEVVPSSYLNPQSLGEQSFRQNGGGGIYGGENTPVDMTKTWEQLYSPQGGSLIPQFQTGGYADNSRGTVAGELGRRGRLPVREAGETMFERRKRLEGYAHGGYAENKTRSEEEQRLKEEQGTGTNLAERHEAPNWYELMGKRPTLGPRRRA